MKKRAIKSSKFIRFTLKKTPKNALKKPVLHSKKRKNELQISQRNEHCRVPDE